MSFRIGGTLHRSVGYRRTRYRCCTHLDVVTGRRSGPMYRQHGIAITCAAILRKLARLISHDSRGPPGISDGPLKARLPLPPDTPIAYKMILPVALQFLVHASCVVVKREFPPSMITSPFSSSGRQLPDYGIDGLARFHHHHGYPWLFERPNKFLQCKVGRMFLPWARPAANFSVISVVRLNTATEKPWIPCSGRDFRP